MDPLLDPNGKAPPFPVIKPREPGEVVPNKESAVPAPAPPPETVPTSVPEPKTSAIPVNEPALTKDLPPTPAPSGDGTATAELMEADLPDTDDMMQSTGDVTKGHEDGIESVGWKNDQELVPAPLIKRLPNEQLWQLIRRFDMVSYVDF